MNIRVGQDYDVHRPVEGCDLILGGVHIPFKRDLLDHSGANASLHALADALLGVAGLGGIGNHFPDAAAEFRDADSRVLLCKVYQSVQALGWRVASVDTTIIAQKPKLAPHVPAIRASIAADLGIRAACVNAKGKTNEKFGYLRHMEAIEAQTTMLLQRADTPQLAA